MPFPWKKARVSRISRLVADLHSPTRGNSLVVETGFPTSLVDLFVKNRDKLRKPWRKKKKQQQQQQQQQELVISDPIPLSSSRDLVGLSDTFYVSNDDQRGQDFRCELVSGLPVKECVNVVNVRNVLNKHEKRVLLVVLKTFIVVVLGFSTKKLAVGITVSAFVLIFLEYVGNHILCFLKPSPNARVIMESLIRRVFSLLLVLKPASNCESLKKRLIFREDEGDDDDRDVSVVDSCDLVETPELNPGIEEIQAVESNLEVVSRVEEGRRTDLVACDARWGCLDVDSKVGVVEVGEDKNGSLACEKQCSRGSKIKTKIMKKLAPKELRGRKKVKKSEVREPDLNTEVSCCRGDDDLARNEVLEEQENDDNQDSVGKGTELLSQLLEEHEGQKESRKAEEDIEFVDEISSSSTGMQTEEKIIIVGETKKKGCCGYLILILIILAGLVGGRIVALMFTVVSCLMLKLVGRCSKLINELLNRSPASFSS